MVLVCRAEVNRIQDKEGGTQRRSAEFAEKKRLLVARSLGRYGRKIAGLGRSPLQMLKR